MAICDKDGVYQPILGNDFANVSGRARSWRCVRYKINKLWATPLCYGLCFKTNNNRSFKINRNLEVCMRSFSFTLSYLEGVIKLKFDLKLVSKS